MRLSTRQKEASLLFASSLTAIAELVKLHYAVPIWVCQFYMNPEETQLIR